MILFPIILSQVEFTEAARQKSGYKFPIINAIGGLWALFNIPIVFAEGFKAEPNNITIGYNENVTIKFGNIDLETGQFAPAPERWFLNGAYFSYSVEFPDGKSDGWFVTFDPPINYQKEGGLPVTNVTISLHSPQSPDQAIQSKILRIKVDDVWMFGNIWFQPLRTHPEMWPLGNNWTLGMGPVGWFAAALIGGFGKYSGKILTDYYYYDVLVKVKPFHSVNIKAIPPNEIQPNNIISIPVIVQNLGNYNDTINFRVKTENNSLLELTQNTTIALKPGEQGQVYVGIASSNNILDTGTLHSITLEAFSSDQPNVTIATQNIMLETQGLYLSEENMSFSIGVIILFFFICFLIFYMRRKTSKTLYKKPKKPWKLPEEQAHLAELKRTDKNAYEQERILMEDEYKSALLAYKDDQKQLRGKPIKEKAKKAESSIFKKLITSLQTAIKPKKKQKEKTKKKPVPLLKKSEKKPKEKIVKTLVSFEDSSKEKILAKIKREQDKQLRKLQ